MVHVRESELLFGLNELTAEAWETMHDERKFDLALKGFEVLVEEAEENLRKAQLPELTEIPVYVRLPRNDPDDAKGMRTLSFRPFSTMTQAELIEQGCAIDGSDAVICASIVIDLDDADPCLVEVEESLTEYFASHGCVPIFR